jgi:hypothetical protein
MKARILLTALVLSSIGGLSATAQELPHFDIEKICRSAQALTEEDRNPVQTCMKDEADAERQLRAIWRSANSAHRENCAAETRIGGSPSYVDVLTCLELAEGVPPAAQPPR